MSKNMKLLAAVIAVLAVAALALMVTMLFLIPRVCVEQAPRYTGGRAGLLGAMMYVSTLSAALFLCAMLAIMQAVRSGNPFRRRVVVLLRIMAGCCLVACGDFTVVAVMGQFRFLGVDTCAAILLIGGLCCLLLSQVFTRAIAYKQDSDLTI